MDEKDTTGRKGKKPDKPVKSDGGSGKVVMIVTEDIRMHPTLQGLLPVTTDLLPYMIEDMRENGFLPSEAVMLGTWPGQEDPVLLDGHMRVTAALEARIPEVPCVIKRFKDLADTVARAMKQQTLRRNTLGGTLYLLCERYDRVMARGRRSVDDKELPTGVGNSVGRSGSAQRTGQLIGCNYKMVEKIRKIIKDGTPEIQQAVRSDKMTINRAYNLIRDMQKGKKNSQDNPSAPQLKAAKILISEENFALLKELDGDVGVHVNKAIEVYMRWLKGEQAPMQADSG